MPNDEKMGEHERAGQHSSGKSKARYERSKDSVRFGREEVKEIIGSDGASLRTTPLSTEKPRMEKPIRVIPEREGKGAPERSQRSQHLAEITEYSRRYSKASWGYGSLSGILWHNDICEMYLYIHTYGMMTWHPFPFSFSLLSSDFNIRDLNWLRERNATWGAADLCMMHAALSAVPVKRTFSSFLLLCKGIGRRFLVKQGELRTVRSTP